ncbi:Vasoactive intestinal polypeptide receptor 1 [Myotis davidii]|uniref:Vasoactive intestinal polypeptide receptor 1 n=1 Tax=Myotis davidii TaxID=225400 RepID=L5LGI1_MYODS|nr:Vasoactive intestinal polypeptide receptor 1 [Myotis davidii]
MQPGSWIPPRSGSRNRRPGSSPCNESGWDWANVRDMCDYLQMIKAEHRQCLEEAELENETAGCSTMWDNITCWPATPRGQVVVMACPLIYSLFYPLQGHNVSRRCTDEGWTELEPSPYPIACVTVPHPRSFHSLPPRGGGCGLCGSQTSWALPSPGAPSLARPAFPGACPLASPDEGAFMRMTQSSKS